MACVILLDELKILKSSILDGWDVFVRGYIIYCCFLPLDFSNLYLCCDSWGKNVLFILNSFCVHDWIHFELEKISKKMNNTRISQNQSEILILC